VHQILVLTRYLSKIKIKFTSKDALKIGLFFYVPDD
jgi:hypothetical protein